MEAERKLRVVAVVPETPPIVMQFPNGRPPPNLKGTTTLCSKSGKSFAVVREQGDANTVFIGKTAPATKPCRSILGIYSETKGTLRLLPILGDAAIRMEPRINGLQYAPSKAKTVMTGNAEATEEEKQLEGKRAALATFGDAKIKKRLKAAGKRTNLETDDATGVHIDTIVESIGARAEKEGLTRDQMMARSAEKTRNLPPHQLDGCSLQEAFLFDALCPPFLQAELPTDVCLRAVTSEAEEMTLRGQGESTFVMQQIKGMRELDAEKQQKRALRLCFLSALIRVHRNLLPIRRLAESNRATFAENLGLDLQLFEHCLSLFFEKKKLHGAMKYQQPDSKLALMRCYILVVALMACDSEISAEDVELMRADLKISRNVMTMGFQSIGGKIMKRASVTGYAVRLLKNGKPLRDHLPQLPVLTGERKSRRRA